MLTRLLYIVSLLPLRALYLLADAAYPLVYYVAGYRRRVVRQNLATSFPEKSKDELRRIERQFYHWLCDYFVEAIKMLSMSDKELRRRFIVHNAEEVEECLRRGQHAACILGHYGNWEWLSQLNIAFPKERVMGLVYKPLRNKAVDKLMIKVRTHNGGVAVPKDKILRYLVKYRKANQMTIFGYIADQAPRWENIHLWLPFLNHDTPVFTGAERIVRKMDNAVFYVRVRRPRRGCYECAFVRITTEPNSLPEYDITRQFFRLLEADIRDTPYLWLWSHRRWKHTHEEFNRRFEVEHGRVIEKK